MFSKIARNFIDCIVNDHFDTEQIIRNAERAFLYMTSKVFCVHLSTKLITKFFMTNYELRWTYFRFLIQRKEHRSVDLIHAVDSIYDVDIERLLFLAQE